MTGTVLIYGGSGGIGFATAQALKAKGYSLHLVARDGERLAQAAGQLGAGYTQGDVQGESVFAAATEAATENGPLAGLVYAVGTINLKPLGRLTQEDFLRDFSINALGAAKAVQAAQSRLKAHGQAGIVLFSSVAVAQGFASHASISMAKGAVEGLTLALAAELAPQIRVNAIAPSLTRTPLASSLTGNETLASSIAGMHALQKLGEPADMGALAAFLVSSEAGWITGQIIGVDGGRATLRTKG